MSGTWKIGATIDPEDMGKGQPNGVAELDGAGLVPASQLPLSLHAQVHSVTAVDHTFPGGTSTFLRADGAFAAPPGGGAGPAWKGAVVGAWGDGDPGTLLGFMQQGPDVVNPTPTNIGTTVARCAYFKLDAAIPVNRIRWYGVGAVSGIYHVGVYRNADSARMSGDHEITTAANAWGSIASTFTLAADTLYFVACSADAVGTTAGLRAFGPTFVAASSLISVIPTSWPGNLDLDAGKIPPNCFAQFAVTAGALPATAPARAVQAAWTGGMPAFFLDNNAA